MMEKLGWGIFGLLCWWAAALSLGAPIFGLVGVLRSGRDPFLEDVGPGGVLQIFLYGSGGLVALLLLCGLFLLWVDRSVERRSNLEGAPPSGPRSRSSLT